MKFRYKFMLLLIGLLLAGCLYISQSYAIWILTKEQTNENEVAVGCFSIGFLENSPSINLNNTYPAIDELGLSGTPYQFTITNTCTINSSYVITLNTISTNTISADKIKYAIYKEGETKPTTGVYLTERNYETENLNVPNLDASYKIGSGILNGGTRTSNEEIVTGGESVKYNLYIWIDELAGNELMGQTFEASIDIINSATTKENKKIDLSKDITLAQEGQDGLYAVEHNDLEELDSSWNKTEYRYAGVDPNNYVEFNGEKWRIIGLVNVKTTTGVEQRIKIIRTDGVESQKNFGNYAWDRDSDYTNNWTTSKLKDMLNGIYYNSGNGDCYNGITGNDTSKSTCDFTGSGSLPKGLDDTARQMIDSEVIWNIGGWNTNQITVDTVYEKERGTITGSSNGYPNVWTKENDGEYHNGIGLMYPSDYGYAVGGSVRKACLEGNLKDYGTNNCYANDWLKTSSGIQWLLSPYSSSSYYAFYIPTDGSVGGSYVSYAFGVWPTVYLSSTVTIYDGDGSVGNPFKLKAG